MPELLPWHEAAALAARAHQGQIRKDGETPYAAHTTRVALIVAVLFGCDDPNTIAAALLHDAIEDCDVDYDDIAEMADREVADIVAALTKDMRMPEARREPAYDAQLAAGPWQARLVKLADVYDNLHDARSPAEQRKFLDKAARALALAGDDPRLARGRGVLEQATEGVRRKLGGQG